MTHHGSPTNPSQKMRRALLHYRPTNRLTPTSACSTSAARCAALSAEHDTDERMQHFGGEVRGAEC